MKSRKAVPQPLPLSPSAAAEAAAAAIGTPTATTTTTTTILDASSIAAAAAAAPSPPYHSPSTTSTSLAVTDQPHPPSSTISPPNDLYYPQSATGPAPEPASNSAADAWPAETGSNSTNTAPDNSSQHLLHQHHHPQHQHRQHPQQHQIHPAQYALTQPQQQFAAVHSPLSATSSPSLSPRTPRSPFRFGISGSLSPRRNSKSTTFEQHQHDQQSQASATPSLQLPDDALPSPSAASYTHPPQPQSHHHHNHHHHHPHHNNHHHNHQDRKLRKNPPPPSSPQYQQPQASPHFQPASDDSNAHNPAVPTSAHESVDPTDHANTNYANPQYSPQYIPERDQKSERRTRSGLFSFNRDKDKDKERDLRKQGRQGTPSYSYGSLDTPTSESPFKGADAASKHSADSSLQVDQQSFQNPYSLTQPSRSDLSLSSAGGEALDSPLTQRSHSSQGGKRTKSNPFAALLRSKNHPRDADIPAPSKERNTPLGPSETVRIVEPELESAIAAARPGQMHSQPPQQTPPQPGHDQLLHAIMASTSRNRSEDRSRGTTANSSSTTTTQTTTMGDASSAVNSSAAMAASMNKEGYAHKEHARNQSSAPREGAFFSNFLKAGPKAADMISKGLFGKGGWGAGGVPEKEPSVDDEHYQLKVINMPLIEQTRKTRISPRLETSRDKTEFWMPALAWRAIDYLNYKGSDVEGLYRVPGSGQQVKKWQRRFDEEYDIDLFKAEDLYDINIIGSMLKAWLRELPDEIFPKETQERIARECAGATEVPQMLVEELSNLPPFNYYLLFAITCHLSLLLARQDKNKMSYPNLCICFQPCMKIDAFCFKFLVQDWRNCWKGCRNEAKYIEAEYALFDLPPPRGLTEPRRPGHQAQPQAQEPQTQPIQTQGELGPSTMRDDRSTSSDNKQSISNRSPTPTSDSRAESIISNDHERDGSASSQLSRERARYEPREAGGLLKSRMQKKKGNTPTIEQGAFGGEVLMTPALTINSDRDVPINKSVTDLPQLQISPIAPLSPFNLN